MANINLELLNNKFHVVGKACGTRVDLDCYEAWQAGMSEKESEIAFFVSGRKVSRVQFVALADSAKGEKRKEMMTTHKVVSVPCGMLGVTKKEIIVKQSCMCFDGKGRHLHHGCDCQ